MSDSLPLTQTAGRVTSQQVHARLAQRLPEMAGRAERETPLADLGLDSLDVVEMLFVVEDTFGVRFTWEEFREVRTLGDLVDAISARAVIEEPKP